MNQVHRIDDIKENSYFKHSFGGTKNMLKCFPPLIFKSLSAFRDLSLKTFTVPLSHMHGQCIYVQCYIHVVYNLLI